jgi:CBS domain containing-hemolysin-like protein
MDSTLLDISIRLMVVILLVLANGFFVAAEFSLVSVRRTRIDELVGEGNRRARVVKRSLDDLDTYIAATQLGITMASIGLGWVGEPALARLLDPLFADIMPQGIAFVTSHAIAFVIAFGIITVLHIVFGELAPKTIALQRSEPTSLWIAAPLEVFLRIFRPFILVLNTMGRLVVQGIGLQDTSGHALVHTEAELRMLVTASAEGGQLEQSEEEMIHRVFHFADLTAHQVMVPRTEIVGVPTDITLDDLSDLIGREGRARMPVYDQTLDDIVGVVHVKDVFSILRREEGEPFDVRSITREALTIPESLTVDELLAAMKARRMHMGIVIDEYGGTAGLVTLEDILEVIVGQVQDEFERPETDIEMLSETTARVNGLVLIPEFNRELDVAIDDPNFDTIGGFVFGQIGRKPELGDGVTVGNLSFRVEALDGLRIARLHVEKISREG